MPRSRLTKAASSVPPVSYLHRVGQLYKDRRKKKGTKSKKKTKHAFLLDAVFFSQFCVVSYFLALFLNFLRGFVPTFFLYCFIFFSFLFSFKDKHIDLILGIFYRTLLHKPCVHLNPVLLCSSGLVDPLSSLSTYSLEVITVLK